MRLCVVVAVQGGTHLLAPLLARLDSQMEHGVEVVLAYATGDTASEQAIEALPRPWARKVSGPQNAMVPQLWASAIRTTQGCRVALTTVHCQPGSRWVAQVLGANLDEHAGVGGPIEQGEGSDSVGWAIYFQRYTPFSTEALGRSAREAEEIAGDNAVYDRALLDEVAPSWRTGFWEVDVHAALKKKGHRLAFDPGMGLQHFNGYTASQFAMQRLRHGFEFGRTRSSAMHGARQWLYRGLSPAIPLLFGRKVISRALSHTSARPHLKQAAPWLLTFLLAWSLGEALGAQVPRRDQ